jgi:HEAT repeat protein
MGGEGGAPGPGGRAALIGLLVACLGGSAAGQERTDPVEELRQALRSPTPPEVRTREVQSKLDKLKTLGDFRRALVLQDWRDLYRDGVWARSDQMQRDWVGKRFAEAVREVLSRGDEGQRVAIAGMLGAMGVETSVGEMVATVLRGLAPDLVRQVRTGGSVVRRAAARALGRMHPEPSVALPPLLDLLTGASAPERQAAAEAVRDLAEGIGQRPQSGLSPLGLLTAVGEGLATARAIVPVAARGLRDKSAEVRRPCAGALGLAATQLGSFLDLTATAGRLPLDPASRRLAEAKLADARALLETLAEQVPVLTQTLADDDPGVRALASRVLETLIQARLRWEMLAVKPAGGDPARAGLRAALPVLVQVMADADPSVRRRVMDVLELVGARPSTLPVLLRALTDRDRFVRWGAVRTLATLERPVASEVLAALVPLLNDVDADIRVSVTRTLGLLTEGEGRAASPRGELQAMASPLLRSLRNRDARVRAGVIRILPNLGPAGDPAIPSLEVALRDSSREVRLAAVQALGAFGPAARSALDALRRSYLDPDDAVREATRDAMLRITQADEMKPPRER